MRRTVQFMIVLWMLVFAVGLIAQTKTGTVRAFLRIPRAQPFQALKSP
jgi:hypothetical protein